MQAHAIKTSLSLKVCFLAGDKRETAVNIAKSCALISDQAALMTLAADSPQGAAWLSCLPCPIGCITLLHCACPVPLLGHSLPSHLSTPLSHRLPIQCPHPLFTSRHPTLSQPSHPEPKCMMYM